MKKDLIKNNEGNFFVWFTVLAAMLIVSVVYITFDDIFNNELLALATELGVSPTITGTLKMAWTAFPIIFLFGLMLYAWVRGQKQEFDTGIY